MNAASGLVMACLVLSAHSLPASKIVGGHNAPDGSYPYQVSLRFPKEKYLCGGAIIYNNFIITAAHCIRGRKPSDVFVAMGSNRLDKPRAVQSVETLIVHPEYDRSGNNENDIGLIRVSEDIEFNRNIQPIALPTEDRNYDGCPLVATGWGSLWGNRWVQGGYTNNLQEIKVKGYPQEKCKDIYKKINNITENQICTFMGRNKGMCLGDSGGPLAANGTLVGLVSIGIPCAKDYPDVYTNVYSYVNWINATMQRIDATMIPS